jgi:hypothetical protein
MILTKSKWFYIIIQVCDVQQCDAKMFYLFDKMRLGSPNFNIPKWSTYFLCFVFVMLSQPVESLEED